MSKILILLAILIFSLSAIFLFNSKPVNRQKVPTFALYKISGEVFYKKEGSKTYYRLVVPKINLPNHTFVKTKKGTAQAILPDKSLISIDQDTEIQINFSDQKTSIVQTAGRTWHRLKKLLGKKEYEVTTPTSVATVRGTKFAVAIAGNKATEIFVTESKVEVAQVKEEDGKKVVEETKEITEGQIAEVPQFEPGKGLKVEEIPQEIKQEDWFKENSEVDKKYTIEEQKPDEKEHFESIIEQKAQENLAPEETSEPQESSPSSLLEIPNKLEDLNLEEKIQGVFTTPIDAPQPEDSTELDNQSPIDEGKPSEEIITPSPF